MSELWLYMPIILRGMWLTIALTITAGATALVIGVFGAIGLRSRPKVLRAAIKVYVSLMRGLPELVVIFLVYFGGSIAVSAVLDAVGLSGTLELSPIAAGYIALSMFTGGYAIEVLRTSIDGVSIGQYEAARSLGLRPFTLWRKVILPQALLLALPGLGNLWLGLMKASALVSIIGVQELIRSTRIAAGATFQAMDAYLICAGLYLVLGLIVARTLRWIEVRAYAARGQSHV